MLARVPFVTSLFYVPLNRVNMAQVTRACTVRFQSNEGITFEDDFKDETDVGYKEENEELKCYDLSIKGYIGLPRTYGLLNYGGSKFVDRTVHIRPRPELFPRRRLKPRDAEQAKFWQELAGAMRGAKPIDIVANATTGAGKTVTALHLLEAVVQSPMLITVPTNYLKNQWLNRITEVFGEAWVKRYVGIIQQHVCDFEGKLICIGLAPSLSARDYPLGMRRYFGCIFFDEWHKIGAPRMSRILGKYPASVRVGLTATNRRDALLKVCTLHLGKPRVISTQRVMEPIVYTVPYTKTFPRGVEIVSDYHLLSMISRLRDRNELLARIIYEQGYQRGRNVLVLSDRTDQLQQLKALVEDMGADPEDLGLLVGEYNAGGWRVNRNGKRVKNKVKMTREQQDQVADTCKVIFATYGVFDTGADVARLDMGVEATPRGNLRQALGRILRILEGKETPEWYGIDDRLFMYSPTAADMFAPPIPTEIESMQEKAVARYSSYRDQRATVSTMAL